MRAPAVTDIAQWLDSIGLGQYAQAFADNAVDWDVIGDLDHALLEAIGITRVGDRVRLLKAAKSIGSTPAAAMASPEPAPAVAEGEAERRQLTVMFCDLVGSTALSTGCDPEDFRALLARYQNAVRDAVTPFDGYIARYMGDGLLIYFGYPLAHEDDAERAVRAALAIVASMRSPTAIAGATLEVRIGVATGLVVAGDIVGEGASEEHAVLGDTPNLAARLQSSASPNAIVIADETRRLIGGLFELADLGKRPFSGFPEPMRSWQVIAERASPSRFETRHGHALAPLVGRRSELALLLERWEQARERDGQAVLLLGETGVGKSRLIQALLEHVRPQAATVLQFQCSPYHTQSAFYPIIASIERDARFSVEDDDAIRLEKLEHVFAPADGEGSATVPLFAALLSVPVGERYAPVDLGTPRRRGELIDALVARVMALADRGPLLMVFEDAHWMDPSTLEALSALVENIGEAACLLAVTARPELDPAWSGHDHVLLYTLSRLSRRHALELVNELAGGKALPEPVLAEIVAKTDGVPLYLEELTQSLLAGGTLRELEDRFELSGSASDLGIPSTLHDSFLARLDRLGSAKEVAQLCAVIGREAAHALVATVAGLEPARLDAAIERLLASRLMSRRERGDGRAYVFKHALVQDAAYASLLKSTRRTLHARVAAAIRDGFPEIVESQPEVLAHHFREAGLPETAIRYWKQAGYRAHARSAHREAASHLETALELLRTMPGSCDRDAEELEMQMVLGPSLAASRSFVDPGVAETYTRALALSETLDAVTDACVATRGLQIFHLMQGHVEPSRSRAEQLVALAAREPDDARRIGAYHALGQTLLLAGEFPAARRVLDEGIALFDPSAAPLPNWPGGLPGEQCLIYSALTAWMMGHPDRARAEIERALAVSQARDNPFSQQLTELFGAMLYLLCRDAAATQIHAERGIALAKQYRLTTTLLPCRVFRCTAELTRGAGDATRDALREAVRALDALGMRAWKPLYVSALADPALNPSPAAEDQSLVRDAVELAARHGVRFFDAELLRLEAQRVLAVDPARGEGLLGEALETARRQSARSLELRAARSLASHWRAIGRRDAARTMLAPLVAAFTEGADTRDVVEARAELDALS